MQGKFSDCSEGDRIKLYIEILKKDENIQTLENLVEKIEMMYSDDETVNTSRIQRDISAFRKREKQLTSKKPILALREYYKKYYLPELNEKKKIIEDLLHILEIPYTLKIFFKTKGGCAEKWGHYVRESFSKFNFFVIADYDSVLVQFMDQKQYNEFVAMLRPMLKDIIRDIDLPIPQSH